MILVCRLFAWMKFVDSNPSRDSPWPCEGRIGTMKLAGCRSVQPRRAGRRAIGWGLVPALHLSCDPRLSLFGRRGLVSQAGGGIDPGSESGTCFPTNRPCRLVPAHQGMKTRGTDSSPWIPAFAGITMALRRPHKRMKMVGRRVGFFHRLVGLPLPTPLDSGLRRNDDWGAGMTKGCRDSPMRGCLSGLSRIVVRDMLS